MTLEVDADFSRAEVLAMERAAARAWPALEAIDVDGWVWRASGGGARRANSVLPLTFHGRDVDAAVTRIEALYAARGLDSYVQVSSIAAPDDLDAILAGRGYTLEDPVLLLAKRADAAIADAASPAAVVVTAVPTTDWLSIYLPTLEGEARRNAAPATLARVPGRRAFLTSYHGGRASASALCVVSPDGVAVVECVASDQTRRRTGAGSAVMAALETWAIRNGAENIALQVVEANTPARALYAKRGYRRAGAYHYRRRQLGITAGL